MKEDAFRKRLNLQLAPIVQRFNSYLCEILTEQAVTRLPPLFPAVDGVRVNSKNPPLQFDMVVGLQMSAGLIMDIVHPLVNDFFRELADILSNQPGVITKQDGINAVVKANLELKLADLIKSIKADLSDPSSLTLSGSRSSSSADNPQGFASTGSYVDKGKGREIHGVNGDQGGMAPADNSGSGSSTAAPGSTAGPSTVADSSTAAGPSPATAGASDG